MARSTVNIGLDRDLLVILLYTASINHRSLNEEIEERIYAHMRGEQESEGGEEALAHLDDVYGQIHGYWESTKPNPDEAYRLPY